MTIKERISLISLEKVFNLLILAKNFKLPPGFMNPPIMMRGRGFFGGRAPRGGGRGGRFRRGFKPY